MTAELKAALMDRFGESTGATRYRYLREFAIMAGLPVQELGGGRVAINEETIEALQEMPLHNILELFVDYRLNTNGSFRFDHNSFSETMQAVNDFKATATQRTNSS